MKKLHTGLHMQPRFEAQSRGYSPLMTRNDMVSLVEYLHSTKHYNRRSLYYPAYREFAQFGPTLEGFDQSNNIP